MVWPFGGLAVWWFRRDRVYRKGLLFEIKRCFEMRDRSISRYKKPKKSGPDILVPIRAGPQAGL